MICRDQVPLLPFAGQLSEKSWGWPTPNLTSSEMPSKSIKYNPLCQLSLSRYDMQPRNTELSQSSAVL